MPLSPQLAYLWRPQVKFDVIQPMVAEEMLSDSVNDSGWTMYSDVQLMLTLSL